MATITFEPWSPQAPQSALLFTALYQAFLGAADNPNRARSLEETRLAHKILDALDAISDVFEPGTLAETRALQPAGGTLVLESAAYLLLRRAAEAHAATVPYGQSRLAVRVVDLLQQADGTRG